MTVVNYDDIARSVYVEFRDNLSVVLVDGVLCLGDSFLTPNIPPTRSLAIGLVQIPRARSTCVDLPILS